MDAPRSIVRCSPGMKRRCCLEMTRFRPVARVPAIEARRSLAHSPSIEKICEG